MQKVLQLSPQSEALFNKVRKVLLALPGTEESVSYSTPSIKVKKKMITRLREDGETLVVHSDDRDPWLERYPDVFFVTDHYQNYPYVLVKLPLVTDDALTDLLTQAWQELAPKSLVNDWIATQK